MSKKKSRSKETGLIGDAGSHFVVSELCRRGWVALATVRNTRGVDVFVMKPDSLDFRALQVKTSQKVAKFWPVGLRWKPRANLFFIFVRPVDKGHYSCFEAFVVPSRLVSDEKTKPQGRWSGSWFLSKSKTPQNQLRNNWESIWESR